MAAVVYAICFLCCLVLAGGIYFFSGFLVIHDPKLRLSSIQNFQYNRNSNTTISVEVTVDNHENYGRYVFENCTVVVLYGNSMIGGGEISGGSVRGRKKKSINVVMRLNFSSSGGGAESNQLMEIGSYTKMPGRIHFLLREDQMITIEMNCTMNLNLNNSSITDLLCR